MRAVRYDAFGASPRIVELPPPACPPDGAVVRVVATGVCRSDWHAWQGHDDTVSLPHVPGHELAGVVAEVGPAVERFAAGDRVTAPFVFACGTCEQCRAGHTQVCPRQQQPGFDLPGSHAELVAVTHADVNLIALPDELGFVAAAGLGCRFGTAYHALHAQARVTPGEHVAVFGCGGVRLSAIQVALAAGARAVAIDVSPAALDAARALGAEVVPADAADADARVLALTEGGAHVVVDAYGSTATLLASLRSLRPRGRHVQVGLLLDADATPAIPMGPVVSRELVLLGSHGIAVGEYAAMLADVAAGRLAPDAAVGRVIGFEELPAALEAMSGPPSATGMTVALLGEG